MFVGIVLAGLVPVGLLGVYSVREMRSALAEESGRVTRIAAEAAAEELRVLLNEQLRIIRLADDQATRTGEFSKTLAYYRSRAPQILAFIAADATGQAIGASPERTVNGEPVLSLDYSDRPYFRALADGEDVVITGRLNSRATGLRAIAVTIARRDDEGNFIGFIGCTLSAQFLGETLSTLTTVSPGLALDVVDRDGQLITTTDARETLRFAPPEIDRTPQAATTDDGVQFDATAAAMASPIPWKVVASRATSYREALAWEGLLAILLTVVTVGAIAIVIGAFVTEQVTQPIRQVVGAMEALERGDLSARTIELKRGHSREVSSLLRSTNASIARLRDLLGTMSATASTLSVVTETLGATSRDIHDAATHNSANVSTSRGVLADLAAAADRIRSSVRGLTQSTSGSAESARMLDGAASSIVQNMETLSGAIETVVGAVQRMETEVGGLNSNISTTQGNVERVSLSLTALNQTIQSVEYAAKESAQLAGKTTEDAMDGRAASAETMRAMQTIIASFQRLSESISALTARSDAIDRIIVVIEDITRATNLLAFNASIIAAQAGEHGAGFAIVAERVKSLADSTRQSTREIGELVIGVRQEITAAAEEITESARSIQDGESLSRKAAESLTVIIESSEGAAQMVGRISDATYQQSGRLRELEQSVEDLRAVNEALARSSNEQRSALQFIATSVLNARNINERVVATARAQAEETTTISSASQLIDSRTKDIQLDTDEQREGTGLLLTIMSNFAELVENNEARSGALDDSVGELTARLEDLNRTLAKFRL